MALEGHQKDFRYILEGDRWKCVHCGACCRNEFEENWLQFVTQMGLDVGPDGICPFLDIYNTRCRIYKERPTTCRGFPFTLRKKGKGGYRLVIHKGCPGRGKGPEIDQEAWIRRLVRLANKQFDKGYKIDTMEKKAKYIIVHLIK